MRRKAAESIHINAKNVITTQIYTEVIDDTKRKAAESIHINAKNK